MLSALWPAYMFVFEMRLKMLDDVGTPPGTAKHDGSDDGSVTSHLQPVVVVCRVSTCEVSNMHGFLPVA